MGIAAIIFLALVVWNMSFPPDVDARSDLNGSLPAYVCLETDSAAFEEELRLLLHRGNHVVVPCSTSYDVRIVGNKHEERDGEYTRVFTTLEFFHYGNEPYTSIPVDSGLYVRYENYQARLREIRYQINRMFLDAEPEILSAIDR